MTDSSATPALTADRLALAALLGGAVAIAFAPIFVRLSELEPTATAFYRFAFALPVLWMWFSFADRQGSTRRPEGFRDYGLLALAGLFFAGDMGFWHWSITYTTVANATLLANTAPVFVVLAGWLIFGLRFRRGFLFGMALAMAGTVILMQTSLSLGARNLVGDLLGVVTGMFYAAYIITIERLRAAFSTATVMSHAISVSALIMLVAAWLGGEGLVAASWNGWAVLLGLALVSQVIGQSLIAYGLAQLPAAFASVGLLVQPVCATLFAWALLGEALGPLQGLGAGVVLAGILLARRAATGGAGG